MKKLVCLVIVCCAIAGIRQSANSETLLPSNEQLPYVNQERPPFRSEKLYDHTYAIYGNGATAYLLIGDTEAVMIDAGMNKENIRAYAQTLTNVPLRAVINTHSHFDHTAGNGFFETIYGTEGISRSAKNTMGNPFADYPLDYTFTLVEDGDIINIGNRKLRIIELDCHSPGNIAILDRTNGLLFPGDELETGQVLLLPGYAEEPGQIHGAPAGTVEKYLHAMKKIHVYRDQIKAILPGHNGTPIEADYLDRYIEVAQRVLDGHEGKKDLSNGSSYNSGMGHFPYENANYRRAEWNGASLVYCADLVWDKDLEKDPCQVAPATALHVNSSKSIYK